MSDSVPPSSRASGSGSYVPRYIHVLIIVALSLIVYASTLGYPFVWDDFNFIKNNPHVHEPNSFAAYLTRPELLSSASEYNDKIYRPLRSWVFAKLYQTVGADPFFYHMLSVALHASTCMMLFLWLARWTGDDSLAGLTSALFAVHPIHTEAVSWISSMADPLSTLLLFTMLWLLAFPKPFWSLVLGLLFPLALLAKEMSITAPFLALLCMKRNHKNAPKGFYLGFSAALGMALAFIFLRAYILGRFAQAPFTLDQLEHCFVRSPYLLWLYAKMIVFPWPQTAYISYVIPMGWQKWLGFLFAFLLAFGAWKWRAWWWRREPWHTAILASVCFMVSLSPIIGIVPVVVDIAERFVYMPSAFLLTAIVAVLKDVLPQRISIVWTRKVSAGLAILVLGSMTMLRNEVWSDDLRLAMENAAVQPPHPGAQWNLAVSAVKARQFRTAVDAYRRYLALAPGNEQVFSQLAAAHIELSQWHDAQWAAEEAIRLDNKSFGGWLNLGVSLKGKGEYHQALHAIDRAIQLRPESHHGYLRRARVYQEMGELEKADRDLATVTILKHSVNP